MLLIFTRILVGFFFIGIVGSAMVVAWTFIEDLRDLGPDEPIGNTSTAIGD